MKMVTVYAISFVHIKHFNLHVSRRRTFLFSLTLSVQIKWDLYGNYFIDIRLTKYDRGHKRSITQRARLSSCRRDKVIIHRPFVLYFSNKNNKLVCLKRNSDASMFRYNNAIMFTFKYDTC